MDQAECGYLPDQRRNTGYTKQFQIQGSLRPKYLIQISEHHSIQIELSEAGFQSQAASYIANNIKNNVATVQLKIYNKCLSTKNIKELPKRVTCIEIGL